MINIAHSMKPITRTTEMTTNYEQKLRGIIFLQAHWRRRYEYSSYIYPVLLWPLEKIWEAKRDMKDGDAPDLDAMDIPEDYKNPWDGDDEIVTAMWQIVDKRLITLQKYIRKRQATMRVIRRLHLYGTLH